MIPSAIHFVAKSFFLAELRPFTTASCAKLKQEWELDFGVRKIKKERKAVSE